MTAVRPPDPTRPPDATAGVSGDPPWWARMLLDALAAGRLPVVIARAVHKRTTGASADPRWRAWYHSLRAVERAAAGQPALSAGQRDTLRALVLGDVPPATPAPSARRPSLAFVVAGLAVASLVLFVVVRPTGSRVGDDVWTARGAPAAVGVRARCVEPSTRTVRSEAEGGTTPAVKGSRLTCAPGDIVIVDATNLGESGRFVSAVVLGEDGAEIAGGEHGSDIAVGPGQVGVPLPHGISLGEPGRRTLFALFFPRPTGDAVRSIVDELRRAGLDRGARALPRLPGEALEQARIDIDVVALAPMTGTRGATP